MKIVNGFRMRTLGTAYIVVPEGNELVNFNKMVSLNSSAAYLWENLQPMESFTVETVSKLLIDKYEISEELASADAQKICDSWIEAGIVEA